MKNIILVCAVSAILLVSYNLKPAIKDVFAEFEVFNGPTGVIGKISNPQKYSFNYMVETTESTELNNALLRLTPEFFEVRSNATTSEDNSSFSLRVSIASAGNDEAISETDFVDIATITKPFDGPVNISVADKAVFPAHYALSSSNSGSETTKLWFRDVKMEFRNPTTGLTELITKDDVLDSKPIFTFTNIPAPDAPTGRLGRLVPTKVIVIPAGLMTHRFFGIENQFGIQFLRSLSCPKSVEVRFFRTSSESQSPEAGQLLGIMTYSRKKLFGPLYTYSLTAITQVSDSSSSPSMVDVELPSDAPAEITVFSSSKNSNLPTYSFQITYVHDDDTKTYSDLLFHDYGNYEGIYVLKKMQIYFSKSSISKRNEYTPVAPQN